MRSAARSLGVPKDWIPMVEAAVRAGWILTKTGGDHVRWQAPSGKIIFSASSPSDKRAMYNTRSMLRREGLAI
jgi:hypothetical protein